MLADITFAHPERIHLVWAALAFVGTLAWLELRGRDVFSRFVSTTMQGRLTHQLSSARRVLRLVLIGLTLVCAIGALMRPQTRTTRTTATQSVGGDIVILLDVSKSMLASDAAPSRLERAKADLRDLLPELAGHRVSLVAFAGRTSVMCPLTHDHGFFQLVLDTVDTTSVRRGGTRIGDALRAALEVFKDAPSGPRLVVLVTDGEDHDSYPLEAADAVAAEGIPVVAIGFGDEAGSTIDVVDAKTGGVSKLVDSAGNVVTSRLDGETLRDIAQRTKGVYVPAGTAVLDLDDIVEAYIRPLITETSGVKTKEVRVELYQWCLVAAILALMAVALISAGVQAPRRAPEPAMRRS